MSEHTPGPWRVGAYNGVVVADKNHPGCKHPADDEIIQRFGWWESNRSLSHRVSVVRAMNARLALLESKANS
jgi:hypothetical protein